MGSRTDGAVPRGRTRAGPAGERPRAGAAGARIRLSGVVLVALFGACRAAPARPAAELTISAAADLMQVAPELGRVYEQETGVRVRWNFGATGQLARQITEGAPVDVFMSADLQHIEDLANAGLMMRGTRALYAVGKLVVWTPPGIAPPKTFTDLAAPRFGRIAFANPRIAPYGHAAEEALRMAGLWNIVKARAVIGENVHQALLYARSGSADAALVSASLVQHTDGQTLVVPEELYPRLYQVVQVVRDTRSEPAARTFAAWLVSPAGTAILTRYGFDPPPSGD